MVSSAFMRQLRPSNAHLKCATHHMIHFVVCNISFVNNFSIKAFIHVVCLPLIILLAEHTHTHNNLNIKDEISNLHWVECVTTVAKAVIVDAVNGFVVSSRSRGSKHVVYSSNCLFYFWFSWLAFRSLTPTKMLSFFGGFM